MVVSSCFVYEMFVDFVLLVSFFIFRDERELLEPFIKEVRRGVAKCERDSEEQQTPNAWAPLIEIQSISPCPQDDSRDDRHEIAVRVLRHGRPFLHQANQSRPIGHEQSQQQAGGAHDGNIPFRHRVHHDVISLQESVPRTLLISFQEEWEA